MSNPHTLIPRALALAGAVLLAACQTESRNPQEPGQLRPSVPAAQLRRPIEEHFAEISKTVPGFAGQYIEGDAVIALVTDLGDAAAVRLAVSRAAADKPELALRGADVQVRKATYTFAALRGWRDQAFGPVLGANGVVSLDLDERRNRVAIGLEAASDRGAAEAALRGIGIPLEAVVFDVVGRIILDEDLQDGVLPLRGGKAIYRVGGGRCTQGFNARWNGIDVFLTNSHCTGTLFANDGLRFRLGDDTVGTEVNDPDGWTCDSGIFDTDECRYSDAAIIRADVDAADILYAIARPDGYPVSGIGGAGTTLINGAILVSAKRTYTLTNLQVYKIGSTTGWTTGQVLQTCVDLESGDFQRVCQDVADYGANSGDSGSPVFTMPDGYATVAGLHWGRSSETNVAYFSTVGGIEADLGTLNVTPNGPPPPFPTVAISGPTYIETTGTYEWQAVIGNASPPYTYQWYANGSDAGTSATLSLYVDGSGDISLELQTNYGSAAPFVVTWGGGEDPPCCDDLRTAPAKKRP